METLNKPIQWVKDKKRPLIAVGIAGSTLLAAAGVGRYGPAIAESLDSEGPTYTSSFPGVGEVFQGESDGEKYGIKRIKEDVFGVDLPDVTSALNQINTEWGCEIDTSINTAGENSFQSGAQDDVFIVVNFCEPAPQG